MSADFISGMAKQATETAIQSNIPSPATAMPDPSGLDVAQFEHSMEVSSVQGSQQVGADTMLTTAPGADPSATPSISTSGDAILGGLQKMTANYNETASNLQQSIEAASNNPGDMTAMFRIQYQMSQLTLQQDLTAKIADRANQGAQTFFKNQ
ncbi:MAG: EscI/YscI/HrpB family type III secretion system inner rod protein [Candidatus Methylacidiphilales bacterium]|nr:EscI/YscI/HrpB family type III secretion system inner rod protein [Candidatus Methylacidiphilales bacterium]